MTVPFVNIHTHDLRATGPSLSVVNLDMGADVPPSGLFSCGIHPWALDDAGFEPEHALQVLESNLSGDNVVALGEAGLDRLHETGLERQMVVFGRQIALSERYRKPLVVHNVRCNGEIVSLRKRLKPEQVWVLHGFNGSEQDVRQFLRHGCCFSVGEALLHSSRTIRHTIKSIPLDRLFFETDTADISVETVYQEAAVLLRIPMDELCKQIFANFARIFSDSYDRLAR